MISKEVKPHRFAALTYRDFRLLWLGVFISNVGTQMQIVAVNWHLYLLTGSAFALGLIGLMRFIAITAFSLLAGNTADSFNRKKILVASELFMAFFAAILGITTLLSLVSPLLIYLLTFLSAIALAFEMPSRQALVPSLVDNKHLSSAFSLNVIMFQLSMVVGPALAGFLLAGFGPGLIYIINGLSFLAIVIGLILMRASGKIEGESPEISLLKIKEGLRFVKSQTMIWSTMLLDFFSTFFASATALMPIFAQDILKVGPAGLGFLYSAESIGAIIAGFIFSQLPKIKKEGAVLLTAVAFYGLATVIFGLSRNYMLSFFALMLVGAGDSVSTIIRNLIRQLNTPDNLRGRMTSINMIFFMGGPQLGEFEAGFVAGLIGAPLSVITGGLGTLAVVGIMTIFIPVLRRYERP